MTIDLENKTPEQIFAPETLSKLLAEVEKDVKEFKADIATTEGRAAIVSKAYSIAKIKTAVDKAGKELGAEWKKKKDEIDTRRTAAWEKFEAIQLTVRKPLTDWQKTEDRRVQELNDRLADLQHCGLFGPGITPTAEIIQANIQRAGQLYQFDWQELAARAEAEYDMVKRHLDIKLTERKKTDEEQVELQRLRDEKVARDRKDYEEKIARDAAEKARLEAETKAERDAARERERIQGEIMLAKTQEEARAKEMADQIRKAAEETQRAEAARIAAEKAKKEAEEKAERDRLGGIERERVAAEEKKALEARLVEEKAERAKWLTVESNELVDVIKELLHYIPLNLFDRFDEHTQEILEKIENGYLKVAA